MATNIIRNAGMREKLERIQIRTIYSFYVTHSSRISDLEYKASILALGIPDLPDYRANPPTQALVQREENRGIQPLSPETAEFRPFAGLRDLNFDYVDKYGDIPVSAGLWVDDGDLCGDMPISAGSWGDDGDEEGEGK